MPEFTHTFEINAADTGLVQGEISYNGPNNQEPALKITNGPMQVTLEEYKEIGLLLKATLDFFKCAGIIEKIEIVKKP